ncbi:hypothetical protein [Paenibacillus lutrae]|uniref:Uncharacterized protein n=1 Tax=Paenibacillus lutrae TaxID=2078573 RepID=A0A7X3JZ41_9BACL|nr:hypothetical protein [Paenibacillus lutrae]MVO99798.1 hypothetical protein [Paenibacillus lutrae]
MHNPTDIDSNKNAAMSAYLFFWLPLMIARQSRFAMYHANQGLVLLLCAIGSHIFLAALPPAAEQLLMPFIDITAIALMIVGIRNAHDGRMKPLPFIGKIILVK